MIPCLLLTALAAFYCGWAFHAWLSVAALASAREEYRELMREERS